MRNRFGFPFMLVCGVIVTASLFGGPKLWGTSDFQVVTVEGTITYSDGLPADGAQVRLRNREEHLEWTGSSAANGHFRAPKLQLQNGDYTIEGEIDGSTQKETIHISQGVAPFLRFTLVLPVASAVQRGDANAATLRVFYVTDRQLLSGNPIGYGSGRNINGDLTYGHCDVSIPRDHRLAMIERPSILRFEFSEDPAKHIFIKAINSEDKVTFFKDVANLVARVERKEILVFIHGYKVTFEDAVYRTAQLAYDLGLEGAPITYSWPSNGRLLKYTQDQNNARWTVPHLKNFLIELSSQSHARVIHLVAHSMGNMALSDALERISKEDGPPAHFREVVLTAPDIDRDTFVQIASSVQRTADRVTIYASSNDRALQISKKINGYPRVGDAKPPILILPGIDTVDVSMLDTDFVGHSYYGDSRSVLSDLFELLSTDSPPDKRFGLRPNVQDGLTYWRASP